MCVAVDRQGEAVQARRPGNRMAADYDLAIIGGGLNGTSLARDAAGRGLRVVLLEQSDLASATSGAAAPLVHGDLARLERRHFFRVRARLAERELWLKRAPHLVRPMRFAMPVHPDAQRSGLWRAALFVYDRLASPTSLSPSRTIDVAHHPIGEALRPSVGTAFEYSDCLVDETRLVILTARDAADRGAVIKTGARCVRAERGDIWRLVVSDRGRRVEIAARALANAAGAWIPSLTETILRLPPPRVRAIKTSQILVRRLFEVDNVYVFQCDDGQLIYASPYAGDFTLIGSAQSDFDGDPAIVPTPAASIGYLCDALGRYLRKGLSASAVVRASSGVNLIAQGAAREDTSDGTILFDQRRHAAPLITMFGGDVTTSRPNAERAVSLLTPLYPMSPRWTATAPLPGGDFASARLDAEIDAACERWPFLGGGEARRLVLAYGSRIAAVLGEARCRADLGPAFGADLTGAEVRHLMTQEWARFADDILWRRSRLGLTMAARDRDALSAFMAGGADKPS